MQKAARGRLKCAFRRSHIVRVSDGKEWQGGIERLTRVRRRDSVRNCESGERKRVRGSTARQKCRPTKAQNFTHKITQRRRGGEAREWVKGRGSEKGRASE